MIGDCSSRGGQSIAAHLSDGYKLRFDFVYILGMIVLIFGLFNIITAVFVESTMKGIASEDTRIKRQEKYQVKYVKGALDRLVQRIAVISETYQQAIDFDTGTKLSIGAKFFKNVFNPIWDSTTNTNKDLWSVPTTVDPSQISLSEGAFNEVLRDERVQRILDELDINLGTDNASLFHIFTKDSEGQVPLPEMLNTVMMLRGGTSKADFIGPSVMIGGLGDELRGEIHAVQEMIQTNHKVLRRCQRQIWELADKRSSPGQ
jgi:hypothetical protein